MNIDLIRMPILILFIMFKVKKHQKQIKQSLGYVFKSLIVVIKKHGMKYLIFLLFSNLSNATKQRNPLDNELAYLNHFVIRGCLLNTRIRATNERKGGSPRNEHIHIQASC